MLIKTDEEGSKDVENHDDSGDDDELPRNLGTKRMLLDPSEKLCRANGCVTHNPASNSDVNRNCYIL